MIRLLAIGLAAILVATACASDDNDEAAAPTEAVSGDQSEADPSEWDLPDTFTAILVRFIGPETAPVAGSDGRFHVVYELWLTNAKNVPATVGQLDVIDRDNDEVIMSLEGDDLLDAAKTLATRPADDLHLDPDESMLVFISLAFDSREEIPDRIVHRLVGEAATNPGSREPEPVDYLAAPWDLSRRTTPVIGPPLRGDGWFVVNGCCSGAGAHRGSVQSVNGTLFDSQRFAIDWMRIDDDGRFIGDGDASDPTAWNAYGADVLAVANGTVVAVLDGLEDQTPGALPEPGSITLETVDGNHVILDLGGGLFVFYAHLAPGSVRVEEGDTVEAGDVLGLLGNTGNTSAPHLHIHLMNRASAIASDSIPYQFDGYELVGSVNPAQWYGDDATEPLELTDAYELLVDTSAGKHEATLPLDLSVVDFPG